MPCTATTYDEIADFIINLKASEIVDDAYVNEISMGESDTGDTFYNFTVTCVYVDPYVDLEEEVTDGSEEVETE